MPGIGTAIRIVREAKGLTLLCLAKKASISSALLSLVESGERNPSLDVIGRLAKALDVPTEAFLIVGTCHKLDIRTSNSVANGLSQTLERIMDLQKKLREQLSIENTNEA